MSCTGKRKRDHEGGYRSKRAARPAPTNAVLDPVFLTGMLRHDPVDLMSMILAWRIARPSAPVLAAFNRAFCDVALMDWEDFRLIEGACSRRFYGIGLMWQLRAGTFQSPAFVDWARWAKHRSFAMQPVISLMIGMEAVSVLHLRGGAAQARVASYPFSDDGCAAAIACASVLRGRELRRATNDDRARQCLRVGLMVGIARRGTAAELKDFMREFDWTGQQEELEQAATVALAEGKCGSFRVLAERLTRKWSPHKCVTRDFIGSIISRGADIFSSGYMEACSTVDYMQAMQPPTDLRTVLSVFVGSDDKERIMAVARMLGKDPKPRAMLAALVVPRHGVEFALHVTRAMTTKRRVFQHILKMATNYYAYKGDCTTLVRVFERHRPLPSHAVYASIVRRGSAREYASFVEELRRHVDEDDRLDLQATTSRTACPHCAAAESPCLANVRLHFSDDGPRKWLREHFSSCCMTTLRAFRGRGERRELFETVFATEARADPGFGARYGACITAVCLNNVELLRQVTGGHFFTLPFLRRLFELACSGGTLDVARVLLDLAEDDAAREAMIRDGIQHGCACGHASVVRRMLEWSSVPIREHVEGSLGCAIYSGSGSAVRELVMLGQVPGLGAKDAALSTARHINAVDVIRVLEPLEDIAEFRRPRPMFTKPMVLPFVVNRARRALAADSSLVIGAYNPR